MSTIMLMHWPEVTEAQYQEARKIVNWEGDVPKGAKFHTAWFADDGFHVFDLWESRDEFETFARERLGPGVAQVGIEGQPNVTFANATATFAPNVA